MQPKTLADFTGDWYPSGGQMNFQHCPVCGSDEKKVYVDPKTGAWVCFEFCGKGGYIDVGLDDAAPGADLLALLDPTPEVVVWSETELPPWEPLSITAVRYLMGRGIGDWESKRLGLVEWVEHGRILIPYFSEGELIFWTSRLYSDFLPEGAKKYWGQPGHKPLYVPQGMDPTGSDSLTLVEGVFDAIRVAQAGCPVVAVGGKTLPAWLSKNFLTLANKYGIINVMLDEDALDKALGIQDFLSARTSIPVNVVPIPGDPGDLPKHEIRRLLP